MTWVWLYRGTLNFILQGTCGDSTFSFGLSLVSLMDKVGLKKNSCKVIDMTNKRGTVETLTETKISCSLEEKVCDRKR